MLLDSNILIYAANQSAPEIEALATAPPRFPWASQRSKTNFQRKTARAVFVSRARQCERAKERRLDTVSWRNQPPADAGFTLPLPGNGDLGLLRR